MGIFLCSLCRGAVGVCKYSRRDDDFNTEMLQSSAYICMLNCLMWWPNNQSFLWALWDLWVCMC